MRKNILAILILAATLINLTLSAIMMFTFIPYTQNANNLVKNILGVIDLELESPLAGDYTPSYKLEDLEFHTLLTEATANLKKGSDGKAHYAQVSCTIAINTADDDYKNYSALIETHKSELIKFVYEEIAKYTNDECIANQAIIEENILNAIQEYFYSRFVVKVTLNIIVQ